MRPANDLLHVMYCASSSLRACTLKLPSVVLRSAFSSLKVNASFTASALTMPRRTRSWISRSSSAARSARSPRGGGATASGFRTAPDLATVPPCDDPAEHDVQAAEAGRQAPVSPGRRSEQRRGADDHEAQPHHRHDPHRKRAAGHEPGAVQQEPRAGQRMRSEEHTSELQSRSDLVCRLLLEKKKTNKIYNLLLQSI